MIFVCRLAAASALLLINLATVLPVPHNYMLVQRDSSSGEGNWAAIRGCKEIVSTCTFASCISQGRIALRRQHLKHNGVSGLSGRLVNRGKCQWLGAEECSVIGQHFEDPDPGCCSQIGLRSSRSSMRAIYARAGTRYVDGQWSDQGPVGTERGTSLVIALRGGNGVQGVEPSRRQEHANKVMGDDDEDEGHLEADDESLCSQQNGGEDEGVSEQDEEDDETDEADEAVDTSDEMQEEEDSDTIAEEAANSEDDGFSFHSSVAPDHASPVEVHAYSRKRPRSNAIVAAQVHTHEIRPSPAYINARMLNFLALGNCVLVFRVRLLIYARDADRRRHCQSKQLVTGPHRIS